MEGQKRTTGFMAMATEVVNATPGLKANEVYDRTAEIADSRGRSISSASDPRASLVATLHKVYASYGLERRKDKYGDFRFYPIKQDLSSDIVRSSLTNPLVNEQSMMIVEKETIQHIPPYDNSGCCINLSTDDSKRIRALVDLGRYSNEHEAHNALVKEGLQSFLSKLGELGVHV